MSTGRWYAVTISYRESTYEKHNAPKPQPFRGMYECFAGTESQAQELALAEFRRTERESSVGWVREVVAVEVRAMPDEIAD